MKKILFLGDIVGSVGRKLVSESIAELKTVHSPDLVIANGENSAGGIGIDPGCADEIFASGVQVITTGNHVWKRKEFYPYLDKNRSKVVRPLNAAASAPGVGFLKFGVDGGEIAVVNLLGQVFMPDYVDSPFTAIDRLLSNELKDVKTVFVDMHGETTSEKIAMGYFLNGRVTAVVGTHTHVQTADERILSGGTAFLTDAGMCGPYDSVIGMDKDGVVEKFVTGLPVRFEVAKGQTVLSGVVVSYDPATGKALKIERILKVGPV